MKVNRDQLQPFETMCFLIAIRKIREGYVLDGVSDFLNNNYKEICAPIFSLREKKIDDPMSNLDITYFKYIRLNNLYFFLKDAYPEVSIFKFRNWYGWYHIESKYQNFKMNHLSKYSTDFREGIFF